MNRLIPLNIMMFLKKIKVYSMMMSLIWGAVTRIILSKFYLLRTFLCLLYILLSMMMFIHLLFRNFYGIWNLARIRTRYQIWNQYKKQNTFLYRDSFQTLELLQALARHGESCLHHVLYTRSIRQSTPCLIGMQVSLGQALSVTSPTLPTVIYRTHLRLDLSSMQQQEVQIISLFLVSSTRR